MRLVLSIGGSVLSPDLEPQRLSTYAESVNTLVDDGHSVGVVVGGGPVAREFIETARSLEANEIELDHIGIAVSRLNARLFIAALGDRASLSPPHTYEAGRQAIRRAEIPVLGGTAPGQTTDAVSAAFAEYVNADRLVYATSVAGVYDADPAVDETATQFTELSTDELIDTVVRVEMNAGSSAPVDLLAAKIIQRAGIEAIVLDGTDPAAIVRAIRSGEFDGTRIVSDGESSTQHQIDAFDE